MGFLSDVLDPGGLFHDADPTGQEARADESYDQAVRDTQLKRDQFDLLQADSAPLLQLRNENINRLLNLYGIGQPRDLSGFRSSPEYTTVRDVALRIKGNNSGQDQALAERAEQLGAGEYGNFHNRIFNTAGFSSEGLNNTNKLLQGNIDSQVNILNNAGAQGASNLLAGAQGRGSAASTGVGLLSAFCDARLKTNARKVGEYHSGIGKYVWKWTEEAKKLVGSQPEEGPMAHEVFKIMPENITEVGGYLCIKDMRLINGY